jgi:ElaB/YqjD/DUF883 family membrane-anchored ribosome-binding protein
MASGVVGTLRINLVANAASFSADMKKARSSIKGFADDSKADLRKYQNEAAKLFRETRTEAEKYRASLERLAALKARGLDTETHARAMAKLRQEFSSQIPLHQRWGDSLRAAFAKPGTEHMGLASAIGANWQHLAGMGALAAGATAAAAAVAALAGAFALAKSRMEEMHETGEMAEMFGGSVRSMSGLQEAAWRKGVDRESLTGALAKMQKNLTGAAGGESQKSLFEYLGLNATALMGKDPAKQFIEIADAISRLPTAAERTAAAMEIFGRGGFKMIRFINEGKAGIQALIDNADKFGLVFGDEAMAGIDKATDAMKDLKQAIRGLGTVFAEDVAPIATWVMKILAEDISLAKTGFDKFRESLRMAGLGPRHLGDQAAQSPALISEPQSVLADEGSLLAVQTKRKEQLKSMAELTKSWWDKLQEMGDDPIEAHIRKMYDSLNEKLRESNNLTKEQASLIRASGEEAIEATRRRMEYEEGMAIATKFADEQQQEVVRSIEAGARMWEETRTPMERYAARMQEIDELLEDNRIGDETARRAAVAAGGQLQSTMPRSSFGWEQGGGMWSASAAKAFDVATFGHVQSSDQQQIQKDMRELLKTLPRIESLLRTRGGLELEAANADRL